MSTYCIHDSDDNLLRIYTVMSPAQTLLLDIILDPALTDTLLQIP